MHGFVIFPVLCLLAYGDTALKSQFLLAFRAHKIGCDNDDFRAVFAQHVGILEHPNAAKQGKKQNDKLTPFCPSTWASPDPLLKRVASPASLFFFQFSFSLCHNLAGNFPGDRCGFPAFSPIGDRSYSEDQGVALCLDTAARVECTN